MLKYCSSPFDTIGIYTNGSVSPCLCGAWHTYTGNMGNLNDNSLKEIFVNPQFTEFKNTIIDQSFKFCNQQRCGRFWNLPNVENLDMVRTLPNLPTNIMLGIDNNCNLKCASCRNGNIFNPRINEQAFNILMRLSEAYQDFTTDVTVFGDGTGDIFASSAYQKWFRENLYPKCFKFMITTNGNLITKNIDLIDQLRDRIQVVVSLDAATSTTYKKVRGGNFEIVLDGITQLVNRNIKVLTQYVVQYENYKEINDYVSLCQTLGISNIGLQKIVRWEHMTDGWWATNTLDSNPNVDYTFLKESLINLSKTRAVNLCGGLYSLAYTPT